MTSAPDPLTFDPWATDPLGCARGEAERLVSMGRLAEAEEVAQRALGGIGTADARDPTALAGLRLCLASCYFLSRRLTDALAQAEDVLALARLTPEMRVQAQLARLRALLSLGDAAGIRGCAEEMLGGGGDYSDDGVLAGALVATALMAWDAGRAAEAMVHLRAAVARSERWAGADSYDRPHLYLAAVLTSLGEFEEAGQILDDMAGRARRDGQATLMAAVHAHAARLALATGRLGAAAEHARAAGSFSARGASYYDALLASVLATVAGASGDSAEAQRVGEVGRLRGAPDIGLFGWAASVWTEVDLAQAQSGTPAALAVLDPALSRPLWLDRLLLERPHGAAWWVRSALAAGDPQAASIVLLWVEHLEAANPTLPSVLGAAAHARGTSNREIETIDRAATLYQHPWSRAMALGDAAALAARTRRPDARQRLEAARQTFTSCGIQPAMAHVNRLIEELGGPARVSRSDTSSSAWESLTDSELRVAFTVAHGLTNAQAAEKLCLSRYTIDFHLRQVFRKLGIGSRVELARLVAIDDRAAGHVRSGPQHRHRPARGA